MADLSITAASVLKGANARIEEGTLGATVTAGQAVYKDAADSKFKLADTDSATAAARELYGIALNGGANGQPVTVQREGEITIGATVVVGKVYVLSGNAGGTAPVEDLASGDYTTIVGIGKTAAIITLAIKNGGVAV